MNELDRKIYNHIKDACVNHHVTPSGPKLAALFELTGYHEAYDAINRLLESGKLEAFGERNKRYFILPGTDHKTKPQTQGQPKGFLPGGSVAADKVGKALMSEEKIAELYRGRKYTDVKLKKKLAIRPNIQPSAPIGLYGSSMRLMMEG